MRDYERFRGLTRATLALAVVVLLINPTNWPLWVGVAGILASEPRYRRAAYRLVGRPSEARLDSVALLSFGHQALLIGVVLVSVAAVTLEMTV